MTITVAALEFFLGGRETRVLMFVQAPEANANCVYLGKLHKG